MTTMTTKCARRLGMQNRCVCFPGGICEHFPTSFLLHMHPNRTETANDRCSALSGRWQTAMSSSGEGSVFRRYRHPATLRDCQELSKYKAKTSCSPLQETTSLDLRRPVTASCKSIGCLVSLCVCVEKNPNSSFRHRFHLSRGDGVQRNAESGKREANP